YRRAPSWGVRCRQPRRGPASPAEPGDGPLSGPRIRVQRRDTAVQDRERAPTASEVDGTIDADQASRHTGACGTGCRIALPGAGPPSEIGVRRVTSAAILSAMDGYAREERTADQARTTDVGPTAESTRVARRLRRLQSQEASCAEQTVAVRHRPRRGELPRTCRLHLKRAPKPVRSPRR